ncbi:ABC transporter permease [Bosea sp. 62]|uniref:ABC transporter permease n=1 Tax=unclassified Bosea (in: a-proteobacteria) TaxID=2653178 RepID=UPI001256D23A|nr:MULTISPECIES: ABC transporter permease [unclassified Bosea (in: a-proteobacteria)]CAD5292814.1 ABC transporter permease [Bosea sp. 21B]CAD5293423.1 ABC transporter permease [Bosea sp. 46]CAD5299653.1 ABC transporter permease [Bosea sp. 7B]VVT62236.1 ABC transporter permease [Bosea sp. EC-HK365B]VXB08375.1 ABC transporter permease [Bosea sp. 125]
MTTVTALIRTMDIATRLAMLALAMTVGAALFAPLLGVADPLAIDPLNILGSPTAAHWLGTDELGRDLFSRIAYGGRVSLAVAAAAVLLAGSIGVPLGIAIAFLGPRAEGAAMRIVDVFVSLPEIFVAIVVLAFLGGSLPALVATIGLLYCPQFARVSYGMARSIRARDHVLAARSLGAGRLWLIRREILPNMRSVIAVQASLTFSFAMLMEAGLSFLGLGVQPPTPSWGQMVGTLKNYIFTNPWPVLVPSLALFVTVLAVNIVGDWLQDRLNPELQR